MKIFCIIVSLVFLGNAISAQRTGPAEIKILKKKEDSLKVLAVKIIQGRTSEDRFLADSEFTRIFVRALKIRNSFYFPFDSLLTISRLAPPDSSFKIFTWQLVVNDYVVRQHGAIQIRTPDGSLKLFPLIDKSDVTEDIVDTVGNNFGWIGAVYYRIIETHASGKNYYTLLGYDENSMSSNKKMVEVLTFEEGQPIFGGAYFTATDINPAERFGKRLVLEYKKNASPRLVYDTDQNMIIYEHLVPETDEPQKRYTYIGDGDYEGLKWQDGKWVHINKIYTLQTKEGEEPVPNPLRDANGDIDPSKLKDNSPAGNDPDQGNTKKDSIKTKVTPTKVKVKKD